MRALLLDYQGRDIRFPEERWRHILGGHPELADMEETIGATLLAPDEIRRDATDPDTVRLYYRWFPHTPYGGKWVKVAVKFLNGDAFVVTAMAISRIKRGEGI